jgi:tricorn protease
MSHLLLSFLLSCLSALPVWGQTLQPRLLQRPTISRSQVAFVYAGDLWVVSREGGEARRLTSGQGLEYDPHFSPDGRHIAFTAEYDGNLDVYVIPASGGEPRRLTYHPGVDVALGWTPDGTRILFRSGRTSHSPRYNKLFTVSLTGEGLPVELPLPMGEQGAYSPDGRLLAYVPYWNRRAVPNNHIAWKRYRGGLASPIWIADLADSRVHKVPREDSNDFCPMWLEGKVWFLSDRAGSVTLYSYDPGTKELRQAFANDGLDLVWAAAGPDAIVYEQFGSLHLFEPKTGYRRRLEVTLTGDFPDTRPRYVKVARRLRSPSLSPTGVRVAFEARGEILTVPAEKGDIRNLTSSPGVMERSPSWSPDGKTVAYFSDEGGEYHLHLKDALGLEPARKFPLGDPPNFYFNLVWSPDSQRLAYHDNRQQLWFIDLNTGQSTKVDQQSYFGAGALFNPDWSPDGRWLAYTKVLDNRLGAIHLYDTRTGQRHQITDGMSHATNPVFDKSGNYLFFTASTDAGPASNGIDMSATFRAVTSAVYLAVLNRDAPSPLAPESDEEKETGQTEPAKTAPAKTDSPAAAEKKDAGTRVDIEGIGQRIVALPLPVRNYVGLDAGKPGVLLVYEGPIIQVPTPAGQPEGGITVHRFDLKTRKFEKVIENVSAFAVSRNGEKVLYRSRDNWYLTALNVPLRPGEGALKLDEAEVYIEPKSEWRQMYREVWRLQRDFLYDPNAHGLDLAEAEKRYEPYLDSVAHRSDLNYLFNEMLGNLVLGHTYISGGDLPEVPRVKVGLLGADYEVHEGRYRFARIYRGENWTPHLKAPLTQPGVIVTQGEYLLAVNGRELRATDNLYKAFEGLANKQVRLKVGPNADGTQARQVTVVPVESETGLRNLAWIEENRRKVDQMTGGRVAYVYLPDTGVGGYTNFNRYFFAQIDKEAVIIDERFNGGGKAADYIIEVLRRPLLNYWTARSGRIYTTPGGAIFGPKVMIVNEFAGSGGDALPWYFRRTGLGPLVGKRTWGGLVGISGYPPLMDGGMVTAPSFAFFSPDGDWDVENRGVAPDIEVEYDPHLVRQGRDPQLEKAVAVVLEELKKNPPPQPKRPPYPNYHRKGAVGAAAGDKPAGQEE